MAVWPNGQGSGRGDARVQRKNEAEILYSMGNPCLATALSY